MSYIDDNLMDGEQVVYRSKLHWAVFFAPIILAVIASMLGEFFLFIAIVWGVARFITFKTSEFGITNKRVLIKVGWIKRNSLETLLTKVEGIQVNQGILGRILNYGTIMVRGTGGTSSSFHKIEKPLQFRKKVQEQITLVQQ